MINTLVHACHIYYCVCHRQRSTPLTGSWSLICDGGGSVVILRSLQWQGMVAYNVPSTPNFGCFYCGMGEKNPDLSFML